MKYGCIGEHLGHSFSKEIHNALADYEYIIHEVAKDDLEAFAKRRDFLGINVTIPYKELIMPYLDEIDEAAKKIGAVNTVVNREGKLFGYNTDFYGMSMLVKHAGIEVFGKKVAILGGGGTSKTANAVFTSLGAKEIIRVSRTKSADTVTYDELYREHSDIEIIMNTTPVGMFPNTEGMPITLDSFERLSGVLDAVYNPLRTKLIEAAQERKIPASGGLYMLVAQAVRASEIFLGKDYPDGVLDAVYSKILSEKENIVLIGMPASGKSTVGKILSEKLARELVDSDSVIVENNRMAIPDIFERFGEAHFRILESEAIAEISKKTSAVIATGGGAILKGENIRRLRQNGRIYFLDRPLSSLIPTSDRPTASSKEMIEKRYNERYGIYSSVCDKKIDSSVAPTAVVAAIIEDFCK